MRKLLTNKSGFTLIEILLVIAIIAVLAAAVVIAINPAKNIADARNTQRRSDINAILSVLSQAFIDNGTVVPGVRDCTDLLGPSIVGTDGVDLTGATYVPRYIASIPKDPAAGSTVANTGYQVCTTAVSPVRYRVIAPNSLSDGAPTALFVER